MKLQFVVLLTFRQTEMPVVARQLGYKHTFCQNVVYEKRIAFTYIFVKKKQHS